MVHAFSTRLFKTRFHWVLLTCETFSETNLCPNRIFNLLPEFDQISLLGNFNMREIIFFLFDLCKNVKWYKYYSNKSDCFQIRIIVHMYMYWYVRSVMFLLNNINVYMLKYIHIKIKWKEIMTITTFFSTSYQ